MELVRDGTVTLKNIDHTINEMMGMSVSQTSVKPVTKNDNLGNLSNSLEQLGSQENENRENSSNYLEKKKKKKKRSEERYFIVFSRIFLIDASSPSRGLPVSRIESMNEQELRKVKNVAQTLDNVMMEIQKHVTFVRSVFDRLCRWAASDSAKKLWIPYGNFNTWFTILQEASFHLVESIEFERYWKICVNEST